MCCKFWGNHILCKGGHCKNIFPHFICFTFWTPPFCTSDTVQILQSPFLFLINFYAKIHHFHCLFSFVVFLIKLLGTKLLKFGNAHSRRLWGNKIKELSLSPLSTNFTAKQGNKRRPVSEFYYIMSNECSLQVARNETAMVTPLKTVPHQADGTQSACKWRSHRRGRRARRRRILIGALW